MEQHITWKQLISETKFLFLLGGAIVAVMLMFQSLNISMARAEGRIDSIESQMQKIDDIDRSVDSIAIDVARITGVLTTANLLTIPQ
jgi:hypothetical protein